MSDKEDTKIKKSTPKSKEEPNKVIKHVFLYNVDDFIKTARQSGLYPNLDRVKAAGFCALMRSKDMYYVEDEKIFKKELDKFMNL